MLPATTRKVTTKPSRKKRTRFPGICGDAAKLGVNRIHLYRVLRGERVSRSLLARYKALKKGGGL